MTGGRRGSKRSAIRQLHALSDPLRLEVMGSLALGPATAAELSREAGVPVDKVRYQLRLLRADGLVQVHDLRQRRGTLEQVFVANPRRALEHESKLAAEAPEARRAFQGPIVRLVFSEVLEAIRTGAFHARPDHTVARVPLTLDVRGYREVEAILTRALERMFAIREESLRRSEGTGATCI
ncbi:MAG TPA: winged helix-turn-helix domain-containing protein, partial [Acidimicrobiales bacterium]|nr:winged helix-turn-helix domain-containing protein [Acidimicrobiales bacterium]